MPQVQTLCPKFGIMLLYALNTEFVSAEGIFHEKWIESPLKNETISKLELHSQDLQNYIYWAKVKILTWKVNVRT